MDWDQATGFPRTVHGGRTAPLSGTPEAAARRFLMQHADLFSVPVQALRHRDTGTSSGMTHVRFEQVVGGVPVVMASYAVHFDDRQRVVMVNGSVYRDLLPADPTSVVEGPRLSGGPVAPAARAVVSTRAAVSERAALAATARDLNGGRGREAQLVVLPHGGAYYLAWSVTAETARGAAWHYYIDAQTGRVLRKDDWSAYLYQPSTPPAGAGAPWSVARAEPLAYETAAAYTGTANVYPLHPGITPTLTPVTLYGLDASGFLYGEYVTVQPYQLPPGTQPPPGGLVDQASSSTQNFVYPPTDRKFEQASIYYHADNFARNFLAPLGYAFPGSIAAQAHVPPKQEFSPSNASYDYTRRPRGLMEFGDGFASGGQYRYSSAREDKVVHHEYAHSVEYHARGRKVGYQFVDREDRNTYQRSAITEGLADYFAGAFTGRPRIVEWAGNSSATRDMADPEWRSFAVYTAEVDPTVVSERKPEDALRYPGGEFFSSILWDVRNDPDVPSPAADAAVLSAIPLMSDGDGFREFRRRMTVAAGVLYNSGYECSIGGAFFNRGVGPSPVEVYISGDQNLQANATGSWETSTACGDGARYTWAYRESPFDPWMVLLGQSGPTLDFAFCPQSGSVTLAVDILGNQGDAYDEIEVYVSNTYGCSGGGGPFGPTAGLVGEGSAEDAPDIAALHAPSPNPTQNSLSVQYDVAETGAVDIALYDVLGRRVQTVVNRTSAPGTFDASMDSSALPAGTYLLRMQAGTFTAVQSITVVR